MLNVSQPDHPPIQAELYAKLQSQSQQLLSPTTFNPKSPGTALSEKLGDLNITPDPGQLGIRPRGGTDNDVLMMLQENNIVDPR